MYIDPKSEIAGYPALAVRKAMKHIAGDEVDNGHFAYYLDISEEEADDVIFYLLENGFLEKKDSGRGGQFYGSTIKGNALAMASAAKPITRKTADKKIAELLERVDTVNSSDKYLYQVKRIILFGSYLSGKETINDIDLSIELQTKFPELSGEDRVALEKKHTENAILEGKRFSGWLDQLAWPEEEVKKFLKSGSRALSMHYGDGIIAQTEHKLIFEI